MSVAAIARERSRAARSRERRQPIGGSTRDERRCMLKTVPGGEIARHAPLRPPHRPPRRRAHRRQARAPARAGRPHRLVRSWRRLGLRRAGCRGRLTGAPARRRRAPARQVEARALVLEQATREASERARRAPCRRRRREAASSTSPPGNGAAAERGPRPATAARSTSLPAARLHAPPRRAYERPPEYWTLCTVPLVRFR